MGLLPSFGIIFRLNPDAAKPTLDKNQVDVLAYDAHRAEMRSLALVGNIIDPFLLRSPEVVASMSPLFAPHYLGRIYMIVPTVSILLRYSSVGARLTAPLSDVILRGNKVGQVSMATLRVFHLHRPHPI